MSTTENFEIIPENDPMNPFDVDSLYPCVIVPAYTCPTCMGTTKTPICVKHRSTNKYYCPICHTPIKKLY